MIELDTKPEYGAKIRIVGVGGGGSNAVNSMIDKGLEGVEFCVLNTDVQALEKSNASIKMQIGKNLTRGLGAGADPNVGRKAVEEDRDEIEGMLAGSDMVFVTAGMGGGTGTGGAAVVAQIAKGLGALVVGIVTKPFAFEGKRRTKQADEGIEDLRKNVDTLIVIPNQKLLALVDQETSFLDGFSIANQVLYNATRGISELIIRHGYINVDFADVRTVMREMGDAIMGSGVGRGDHRASQAAENAISSPLLEGVSISGAQGVLVNITGGRSMTLLEVSEATQIIHDAAGDDANLIFGAVLDDTMEEQVMVTVIATGFNTRPKFTALSSEPGQLPLAMPRPAVAPPAPVAAPRIERMRSANPEPQNYQRAQAEEQPLPKVERIYQPRGTLTERERTPSFERTSMDRVNTTNIASQGIRITPRTDQQHVPSGPRDLKEYDQPAYLRRGITLPPIEEQEDGESNERELQAAAMPPAEQRLGATQQEQPRQSRDDRPTFLRRIMD